MRHHRPALATALLPLLALALLADGGAHAAGDAARAWRWLDQAAPDDAGVRWAPKVGENERVVADRVRPAVLPLVLAPAGTAPEGSPVVGTGVVIRRDGVVLSTWRTTSLATRARWLWTRAPDGAWVRAVPAGATWWGDVGLLRLVSVRRAWPTVAQGDVEKRTLRRRYIGIGAARGSFPVVTTARLRRMVFFDPSRPEGRLVIERSWKPVPKEGALVALAFEPDLATRGGAGTAVFDEEGRLVGLVSETAEVSKDGDGVLVRPLSYVGGMVEAMLSDGRFDPPDLGIRLGPAPQTARGPAPVPPELQSARLHERGGAIVEHVLLAGPANRILWEGDVVLEIEGRPVFGEIYESRALAMLALRPGLPTDIVVLRGGERRRLQVTARRGREIYGDFMREHLQRAGALPW